MPATTTGWYDGVEANCWMTATTSTVFVRTVVTSATTITFDWTATTAAAIDTESWLVTVTDGTVTRVEQQRRARDEWVEHSFQQLQRMAERAAQQALGQDQRRRRMTANQFAAQRRMEELERHARQQEAREQQRQRQQALRRAERRALVLLLTALSAEQRAEFRQHGYFHAIGGHTGTRYRIRKGRVGNIDVLHRQRLVHRLCCHPEAACPDYDVMVAQLLHLQDAACEPLFVARANIHPLLQPMIA